MKSRLTLVGSLKSSTFHHSFSDVMFYLMDINVFPGKTKDVYKLTRMDKDSLNNEILWAQKQIQVGCIDIFYKE